jgi:hypothetical protein
MYGIEDVYLLLEIALVDAHNKAIANKVEK